jgi:hypothetical protein
MSNILKSIILTLQQSVSRFLLGEWVEVVNCHTIDLEPDDAVQPAMFANYPDVVGVTEICCMLGGISKKLARKLLSSGQIEHLLIGREFKSTKEDVIAYIYNNKK